MQVSDRKTGEHIMVLTQKTMENLSSNDFTREIKMMLNSADQAFRRKGWFAQVWVVLSDWDLRKKIPIKLHAHVWIICNPSQAAFEWIRKWWETRHGKARPQSKIYKPAGLSEYMFNQAIKSWCRSLGKSAGKQLGEKGFGQDLRMACRKMPFNHRVKGSLKIALRRPADLDNIPDLQLIGTCKGAFRQANYVDRAIVAVSNPDQTTCLSILPDSNLKDVGYTYSDAKPQQAVTFFNQLSKNLLTNDSSNNSWSESLSGKFRISSKIRISRIPMTTVKRLRKNETRKWVVWRLGADKQGRMIRRVPSFEWEFTNRRENRKESRSMSYYFGKRQPDKVYQLLDMTRGEAAAPYTAKKHRSASNSLKHGFTAPGLMKCRGQLRRLGTTLNNNEAHRQRRYIFAIINTCLSGKSQIFGIRSRYLLK